LGVFKSRFKVPPGIGFTDADFVGFDLVAFGLFAQED
jgi:hypothetical protein